MRCLYSGCEATGERGDDTFHKVVGSSGRDGNPLYICTEHFEKLKSSKSPSLVSCKQRIVKSAAIRKENRLNEGIETIDLEPKNPNQEENRGDCEVNFAVRGMKVTTGSTYGPCKYLSVSTSLKSEREVKQCREVSINTGDPNVKNESTAQLKTSGIVPSHGQIKSRSFPSILRRKREVTKDRRLDDQQQKSNLRGNEGILERKEVVENRESIQELITIGQGNLQGHYQVVRSRGCPSSIIKKKKQLGGGKSKKNAVKPRSEASKDPPGQSEDKSRYLVSYHRKPPLSVPEGSLVELYTKKIKSLQSDIDAVEVEYEEEYSSEAEKPDQDNAREFDANLKVNCHEVEENAGNNVNEHDLIENSAKNVDCVDEASARSVQVEGISGNKSATQNAKSNQQNQLDEYKVLKQSNVKLYKRRAIQNDNAITGNNVKTKSPEENRDKKHSQESNAVKEGKLGLEGTAVKARHVAFEEHILKGNEPGAMYSNDENMYEADERRNVKIHVESAVLVLNDRGEYEECVEVEPNQLCSEECTAQPSFEGQEPRLSLEEYKSIHTSKGDVLKKIITETLEDIDPIAERTDGNITQFRNCSAVGCHISHPYEKLFRFPCDSGRNKIWCQVAFGKDTDIVYREGYLCARHFRVSDFYRPNRQELVRNALPSYPTGPLNPSSQDYCPIEDVEILKDVQVYCSAVNCGLSLKTHSDVTFTPFPSKGDSRYQEWSKIAGEVCNPKYLCSRHFDASQFSDDRRTCIKPRAIPKYKSGPLNPKTNDYASQHNESDKPPDDPTATVPTAPPVTGAVPLAISQIFRISGPIPAASRNLKVRTQSSIFGQNVVLAGTGGCSTKAVAVADSPLGPGLIIKIPTATESAGKPNQTMDEDPLKENEMNTIYKRCDAVNCPSSYKNDPKVKYFSFPAVNSSASEKRRHQVWIDAVGGTKDGRARYLCQYHFAADTFINKWRTVLVRKANPLFAFRPLNPITNDYCPVGEERRSLCSRDFLQARCCVDGCTTYSINANGLFRFPLHDREAYDEWTKRIGVYKYFTEQHIRLKFRICPNHFSRHCTTIDSDKKVHLMFGALPTINIPCFDGPPNEINSFVQSRSLSSDEIDALKMFSESGRVCDLNDVFELAGDTTRTPELKRKIDDEHATSNKKPKGDQQLVLLPVQDSDGQQTYMLADFSSNENLASISGQTQNPMVVNQKAPCANVKLADVPKSDKPPSAIPHSCTYWSPDELNDKASMIKKREEAKKLRMERLKEMNATRHSENRKRKTVKEMYEDFSLGIQEENIGNEVDIDVEEPLKQTVNTGRPQVLPTEKTDNTETALLKIFGACDASDDNVFSCFIDPSKVPEYDEDTNVHSYCSSNSLNVIRSAAELCEFNDLKLKQLERLIGIGEETSSELEQILIKHLSSVMCITGVEFLKKCFNQVLKEEITRKKEKDKTRKNANSKVEPNVPLNVRYPTQTKQLAVALQTMSGKAYHAMTQLMDLPSQSITRDWTCHENGDPGFSVRAFKLLEEEVVKKRTVTVSLGLEEVPLKQDVTWDGERAFGFTDLGYGAIDYDYIPEATRALVFFAVALNQSWKIPLGYCLADNLSPAVRANLVIQYLYKLAYTGVKCIALVCNYSLVSYQMLVELGAISEEYYAPLTGSFPHPSLRGDRVHCFIDIHQIMKSINTLWAEKKVFTFKNKEKIEWSHINRMNELIRSDNTLPEPGLKNVYNDLLSLKSLIKKDPRSSYKYNALVLALMKNLGLEGFENVTETAVFLDKLNLITELFSSCHPQDEKEPVNKGNYQVVTQKLNSVITYFNNLTYTDGTKVITSTRKLPLVSLFSNITSLKTMIKKVFAVEKYKLVNIKTESLTLDCVHQTLLEITHGKDGLLTPLEFKNAFFKFVDTLSVEPSSRFRPRHESEISEPLSVEKSLGFSNAFSYQFEPVSTICENVHEFFTENVIENWLEVSHCTDCSQLIQKELLKYGNHDSKGNIVEDIHRMLRLAETILAELEEIPMDSFTSWFDKLANKTLNSLTSLKGFKNNSHLFNSKPFGEVTHFTVMVKDMLRIFLRLRLCFLSRQEKIKIRPPRQYSLRFCLGRSWA